MSTFYKCINLGVIAIVTEETYGRIQDWEEEDSKWRQYQAEMDKLYREAEIGLRFARSSKSRSGPYPKPIFTFLRTEADGVYPFGSVGWLDFVNGDLELMDLLLEGHEVIKGTFYVPFSNPDLFESDMYLCRTTLGEAMSAFGLRPSIS